MKLPEIKELRVYTDWLYDICCIEDKEERLKILNQFIIVASSEDEDIIDRWTTEVMGGSRYWEEREKLEGEEEEE